MVCVLFRKRTDLRLFRLAAVFPGGLAEKKVTMTTVAFLALVQHSSCQPSTALSRLQRRMLREGTAARVANWTEGLV